MISHLAPSQPVDTLLRAVLVPLTHEAASALGGQQLSIDRWPFRVGRERRQFAARVWQAVERRLGTTPALNDLYLIEGQGPATGHISSAHFLIERSGGRFFLVDRGTQQGTLVEGRRIGGDGLGGRAELTDRSVVTIGTARSPYTFRFRVLPD